MPTKDKNQKGVTRGGYIEDIFKESFTIILWDSDGDDEYICKLGEETRLILEQKHKSPIFEGMIILADLLPDDTVINVRPIRGPNKKKQKKVEMSTATEIIESRN